VTYSGSSTPWDLEFSEMFGAAENNVNNESGEVMTDKTRRARNHIPMRAAILIFTAAWLLVTGWSAVRVLAQEGPPTGSPAKSGERKPNIILMLADNLGYGDLGSYGGGDTRGMPTPRLDQLASQGVRFTQFLVEASCTPSRAALMTGRYSIRSGLSLILVVGTTNTLSAKEVTLARVLKDGGYDTAMFGKWHLGTEAQSQPQNQGFDEFYGILNSSDDSLHVPMMMKRFHFPLPPEELQPHIVQAKAGGKLEAVKPYTTDARAHIDIEIADLAVDYVKQHAQGPKPFFLYLPWTRPHYPNLTTAEFEGKSRIGPYGDCVMEMDYNVGRVLDALKQAGIEDNTIIVFASDNGPSPGINDIFNAGSSGPFRSELGDPLEGSLRTVGMIRWPGKIRPRVSNEMFSEMDFFPTLAKFAGVKIPTDRAIDGIDQSAYLLGQQDKGSRQSMLTFIGDQLVAVRWHQWRYYMVDVQPAGAHKINATGVFSDFPPTAGYPLVYNIELDPREEHPYLIGTSQFVLAQ
jgi:arylsulfatase A-like enzyme